MLGVAIEHVVVNANDTAAVPVSLAGTRASRTAVVIGGAVLEAARDLRERVLLIAGHLLEADPADLELEDGAAVLRDAPSRRVTIREVAEAAYLRADIRAALAEPDLSVSRFYDPPATYSNGCVVCTVEIDPRTGLVAVRAAIAVEDCGTIINPLIVDGQIRGAVAQGIGGALLERVVYGEDGQPQAGTLMDYPLPTASVVPPIQIAHCVSPSPLTVGGIKGMGESGLIATPAAVASAVADALGPFGARVERLPLTPELVLSMMSRDR
jgi:carbon-monoxide dehydrogenase large subunit